MEPYIQEMLALSEPAKNAIAFAGSIAVLFAVDGLDSVYKTFRTRQAYRRSGTSGALEYLDRCEDFVSGPITNRTRRRLRKRYAL